MCDVNINSNYNHEKLLNRTKYLLSNIFITFPIYNKISCAVIPVRSWTYIHMRLHLIWSVQRLIIPWDALSEIWNEYLILVYILLLKHNFTIFIW